MASRFRDVEGRYRCSGRYPQPLEGRKKCWDLSIHLVWSVSESQTAWWLPRFYLVDDGVAFAFGKAPGSLGGPLAQASTVVAACLLAAWPYCIGLSRIPAQSRVHLFAPSSERVKVASQRSLVLIVIDKSFLGSPPLVHTQFPPPVDALSFRGLCREVSIVHFQD